MVTFKLVTEKEIKNVLELMPHYYQDDHLDFVLEKATNAVTALVKNSNLGQLWLMIDSQTGEAMGYMALCFGFSLEFGGRDAFVDELFVLKKYRGRGIGTQALEHAVRACREAQIVVLRMEVTKDNLRALNLYKKLGYQDFGRSLLAKVL